MISTCSLVLHGAVKIPKMDTFGHADPYGVVYFPATCEVPYHKTKVSKGENPTWEETISMRFGNISDETNVRIVFWDSDLINDDYIGEVVFSVAEPGEKIEAMIWDKKQNKNTGARLVYSSRINMDKYRRNTIGMLSLNPEWTGQPGAHSGTTLLAPQYALPIMSNVEQFNQYLRSASGTFELAPNITSDPQATALLDSLSAVFARYEVPMGLVSKLLVVSKFDAMEFIIDDSGSMALQTDMRDPVSNMKLTRWNEVKVRFKMMLEVISYLDAPPIYIYFLNCPAVLELKQAEGESGFSFMQRAFSMVDNHWLAFGPTGTTPAKQRIAESLARHPGKSVMRYFFGDGVPDDQRPAIKMIVDMLMTRPNPEKSPFTFFSCTNNEKDTEWMKECEEAAPFVSEYDDFNDEAAEVLRDQGEGLPFSQGMYLIGTIVGAVFPDDLDCMDESVPFSKHTLEALQGYTMPLPQYEHYFKYFLRAQQKQKVVTALDQLKRNQLATWNECFPMFLEAVKASDIPQVREFKTKLYDVMKLETKKK